MNRIEYPAGSDQLIVLYVSDDSGSSADVSETFAFFARDAATLDRDGWQIVSTSSMPIRQMGTAGNIFFQSGGQYATQVAIGVVYGRRR